MLSCAEQHLGATLLPRYIGESAQDLLRLDLTLAPSTWGVWIPRRVDLRATARVRACREFLIDIIEQQRSMIAGADSRYWTLIRPTRRSADRRNATA